MLKTNQPMFSTAIIRNKLNELPKRRFARIWSILAQHCDRQNFRIQNVEALLCRNVLQFADYKQKCDIFWLSKIWRIVSCIRLISYNHRFNANNIDELLFFGIFSAVKWAIAANRADLLEKKLSCITKYYLCSEHFSDDCFVDPPHNSRLKKTLNPISIPVPTIFKCNIDKYIPNSKRNANEDFTDDVNEERIKLTPNYGTISDFSPMNRSKEGISMESLSVFHDHYNYADISSCSASFFNDIAVSMNDLSNENSFDHITGCDPLSDIADEIQHSFLMCRLCAKTYSSSEHLKEFASEPGIYETLDTILPNQVSPSKWKKMSYRKEHLFDLFHAFRLKVMTIFLN